MTQPICALPEAAELSGRAVFLEAESGPRRTAQLSDWLAHARERGSTTWLLDGDVDVPGSGVWAGLRDLLESILPRMRKVAPHLIERHSYELCLVLPALRRELSVKNPCLTDVANDDEKVRNYANDRGYRSLHGIIDLVAEWHELEQESSTWAIAVDNFDLVTPLVQRFFAELLRRRGRQLQLALLLGVSAGSSASSLFDPRLIETVVFEGQVDEIHAAAEPPLSPAAAGALARELEDRIGEDRIEWSMHIPRLIRLWQRSNSPERALRWLVRAINVYDHDGLYEVAVRYAPEVEANFDRMFELDRRLHTLAVINVFFCYAALGQAEKAHHLLLTEGLPKVEDPLYRVDIHYFMAMLHARFLPRRDQDKANWHLDQALALIAELDTTEAQRHFLTVFVRNGLAYVRLKQGRADEGLALCRSGLAELDQYLPPSEHRLHRSVLLYNAAQVLGGIGRDAEAIEYLSRAMEMDPNYSEYYLERGGLFLKTERFDEAEQDLRRAIELSPPYQEAWTDLGQCYRASGRMADAWQAYDRALDLDPKVTLALIGRAEAALELGQVESSVVDYTAALDLDPNQALVLAGRAIAHFEQDRPVDAVLDLDRAIELSPETAELYQNRAVALQALGRTAEAAQDLRTYLRLQPEAEDHIEVEHQLNQLDAGLMAA